MPKGVEKRAAERNLGEGPATEEPAAQAATLRERLEPSMDDENRNMGEAGAGAPEDTTVLERAAEASQEASARVPGADQDEGGKAGKERGPHRRKALLAGAAAAACVAALGLAGWALCSSGTGATQAAQPATTETAAAEATGLSVGDVARLCADLMLDNAELGVDPSAIRVEAADGHVMITQASGDDAPTMVDATARRSAALARALKGLKVAGSDVADVTWVTTDPAGSVKVAFSNTPDGAPDGGTTADVVNGSGGHRISDDVWDADGVHDQGYEQSGGDAPKDPSGNEIEPGATTPTPEQQPTTDAAAGNGAAQTPSSGTGNAGGTSAPAGTGSGAGSANSGSSSGSSGSTATAPQKKWVEEQGHWEADYKQVWVPSYTYVTHPRYYVNHGGTEIGPFDSEDAAYDWIFSDAENGGIGGSVINDSWEEKIDNGHYETQQSGQHWVVDVPGHWE